MLTIIKKLNKQKWLFRISLFLLITFFTLVFISVNTTYLISSNLRLFMILFSVVLIVFMFITKKSFKFNKIFITLFCIYFIGCSIFLTMLYGPKDNFRVWLITTALSTSSHEYYCLWFYDEDAILTVTDYNYMIEPDEITDSSLINTNSDTSVIVYENEYEEAILDREEGTLYKIIEFEVNGENAYLAVIYDPSTISAGITDDLFSSGQYVTEMAEYYEAPLAINAGRFSDASGKNGSGAIPSGITIVDGEVLTGDENTVSKLIGFNEDNVLMLIDDCTVEMALEYGITDAVYSTPFLIVNGTPSYISGNGGFGMAGRTAIGQREDGIVLFLVVDSNEFRTNGASMEDLTEIMLNYGAVNAANLDGGTSSVMAIDYEIINDPISYSLKHKTRPVATIFYVK